MNSNNDLKKMLRTTIISFIIIAFGLLFVCGVRPPQPSFEGMDTAKNGDELTEDDDLASLLNDGDKNAKNDDSSSGGDILGSDSESSDIETDDMNEILSLLESDDENWDDDSFDLSGDYGVEDKSPVELASVSDVTSSPGGSEEAEQFEGALGSGEFTELQSEADRLTEVLNNKSTEAESLKNALEKYDEKIAVIELENAGAGSDYAPASTSTSYKSNVSKRSSSSYSKPSSPSSSSRAGYGSSSSYSRSARSQSKRTPYERKYQSAVNYFTDARYRKAIEAFEELIATDQNHSLADDCQYYLGECFLAQNNVTQAIIEFEKVFVFDNNDKTDDAQMKLGLAFMKKGDAVQAKMEFDNLLAFYSDSEFARNARTYLKQL